MLILAKTYGQVFKLKNKGSTIFCEFRTIHKENGKVFVNRWKTFFVGDSIKKALELNEGSKITITKGTISNINNADNKSVSSLYISDFDIGNTIKEQLIECPF